MNEWKVKVINLKGKGQKYQPCLIRNKLKLEVGN